MKSAIVFGASGFLGSALVNELSKQTNVHAVVRPFSDVWRIRESPNVEIIRSHENSWHELISFYNPGVVICAQWKGTSRDLRNNSALQYENLNQILSLANAAVSAEVGDFLVFGSQAETQMSKHEIEETRLNSPSCIYGEVKVKLYDLLDEMLRPTQTRFIWERVFSVFGPNEIGNSLLPTILKHSAFGEKLLLENPRLKWSYLYIDDFVSATLRILNNKDLRDIVNVGNPNLVSIEEICSLVPGGLFLSNSNADWDGAGYFPKTTKLLASGWRIESDLASSLIASSIQIRKHLGI